ncbi:hypothetical protein [Falsiroseomonas sp.]|uniref:hypothetical protein n=1 Tax=Falsiroseomonas sp. TaxID=2870721 RepID=UPI003F709CF9
MNAGRSKPPTRRGLRAARSWLDLAGSWGRAGANQAVAHRPGAAAGGQKEAGRKAGGRASATPARLPGIGPAEAAASWDPADGDAYFQGWRGADVLTLRQVTLTQLISAINVRQAGLSLHLDRDGGIGFIDRAGEPCAFSGDLTLRGATLRWDGVMRILLG